MRGSILQTDISSGTSAHRAVMSVLRVLEQLPQLWFRLCYKPCVARGRNHHGNMRIGASAGSDTDRFLGGIHLGYEQNYTLRHGWKLFWQVKTDVMIKGEDLFRTGIVLGVKLPVK